MPDLAMRIFQVAEEQLRTGKYETALANYLRVIRGAPRFWRARFRIADTMLNFKMRNQALEIYKALAWHALKGGQPLEGLVAIKMASLLDPSQKELIDILATMYSRSSDRLSGIDEANVRPILKPEDSAPDLPQMTVNDLIAAASTEAADTAAVAQYPDKLPTIPLFSFLEEDAFSAVLSGLQLRRFVRGNKIIEEGAPGDSFFILAEGNVAVMRSIGGKMTNLARLHAGAVFGEMALISRAPRTATVVAEEDCEILEFKRASLESEASRLASVTKALKDFTHDRFLANLTATSALFKPFPKSIRTEIIKKFQDLTVPAQKHLIVEGQTGEGLYLILKGQVEVIKKGNDGAKVSLATLKEGEVFGEISLIQDTATTATCTTMGACDLLYLPKKDFKAVMARHPELKDELAKITADRIQKTKAAMSTAEQFEVIEDDEFIML